MGIISSIYKAPATLKLYDDKDQTVYVAVCYYDRWFTGSAYLHKDDEGFYSKKVGCNIALSRARMSIMEWELERAKADYKTCKNYYDTVMITREPAAADPSGGFERVLKSKQARVAALKQALKDEDNYLKSYIIAQDKAIKSVRAFRAR